ncbi:MAG: MBL fold metallo-hydrolase [Candidatus Paceibacterota bacterium]|jgi:L-ascorbate metabolism protein UlaG (beta-lactamase superfamily)
MKLEQFEQSGLIIEADNGYRFAIDIACYTPLEKLEGKLVDAMLVTHRHGDHFDLERINKLSPKDLYLGQECRELITDESPSFNIHTVTTGEIIDLGSIKVKLFDVDHGPNVTAEPRENFGLFIEVDGKKVFYTGEMFSPTGVDVSGIEADVVFLPVGTFYTFGPEEAVTFASQFKKVGKFIPMHYYKDPETKDDFIRLAQEKGLNV